MTKQDRQSTSAIAPAGATLIAWLSGVMLVVLFLGSFMVGKFDISPAQLVSVIYAWVSGGSHNLPPVVDTVIFQIRLPRVIAAMLVGAALAAAGATYQGMFRNPLVSPDILGVSAGAGLGAVLGIFFSLPVVGVQLLAFVFGLGTVFLVYVISRTVLKVLADPYDQLPAITFWLLGSLTAVNLHDVASILPLILLGLVPLYLLRWRMNLMSLGDEEAQALGIDAVKMRIVFICAATLITAAAVSISGIIGWVGLMMPHIARMLVGPSFSRLLPVSILLGGGYLLAVDDLARVMADIEVPLGILTAFLGAPFFLWLLATTRRGWQ
jgi:iron complex transport system permease protein